MVWTRKPVFIFLLCAAALCVSLPAAAQTEDPFAIRVESDLVVVHTEVYDKRRLNDPGGAHWDCLSANANKFFSLPMSVPFIPDDCLRYIQINGLNAADFHVFEDGLEQKIASVRVERRPIIWARANLGWRYEWSSTPRGKWSSVDLGGSWEPLNAGDFYQIAYVPTKPAEGKCHHISVTVDRPRAVVSAADQYCYTKHPATDPLEGTNFGKQMETDLDSDKRGRITPLFLQASFFYANPQTARVEIVLEFPWELLKHEWMGSDMHATIGVLGVAYKKDRTLSTRFSDFACCGSGMRWFGSWLITPLNLPSHYETQIDLPAGAEYGLRVLLSDGSQFGRAVAPLPIDSYDGKQLAISSVVLCDRFRDAGAAAQEAAAVNFAPRYVPLVSQGLAFTPAAETRFKRKERLIAYFEVYEPVLPQQPKASVQADVRIVDAKTGERKVHFRALDATSSERPGTTVFAFAGDVPTAKLSKGDYRVEAQATDSAGRKTIWRSATFTME